MPSQLESVFGELLDRCLVSRITYYPDTVLLAKEGQHYMVPAQDYGALTVAYPDVATHRFRAFSASNPLPLT